MGLRLYIRWQYLLLIGERPLQNGYKMLVYKGYKISASVQRAGLIQVSDIDGNVLALMSMVRECKQFIDQLTRKAGA